MTDTVYRACRYCRTRQRVEFTTDGAGGLLECPLRCGCNERRVAGICLDCDSSVEGWVRVALRCGPCKQAAVRAYSMRWRETHPERAKQAQQRSDKKRRDKKRQYHRDYWRRKSRDPLWRKRRNRRRQELAAKNPGRKAEYARRYKARHPERVKEQERRTNVKRAAAKREYQHLYATKYVGERKKPVCRQCGGEVPWKGLGRPRLDCYDCRPMDSREVRAAELAVRVEAREAVA